MAVFLTILVLVLLVGGVLALIILAVEAIFNSAAHLGESGQAVISKELRRLNKHDYAVIDGVNLLDGQELIHIDHIVVSKFGVFLIETNPHTGDIYGKPHLKKWKQVIGYHDEYKLDNPIKKAQRYETVLHKVLRGKLKGDIILLVAFPFARQLNVDQRDMIGKTWQINEKIRSHTHEVYNHAERVSIIEAIKAANVTIDPSAILPESSTSSKIA